MTLDQIEALNGRPFKLYGFGFDYGGTTLDWNGGALATQAGGCTLTLRFTMREGADNAAVYVGEQSFMSDDDGMRKAAPVVDAVGLRLGSEGSRKTRDSNDQYSDPWTFSHPTKIRIQKNSGKSSTSSSASSVANLTFLLPAMSFFTLEVMSSI